MPIAFKCPGCGKDYKVPDEFGGRSSKCRQCGATMAIPQASTAVTATPPPPPAAPPSAPAAPTFGQKVKARMIQQAKWRLIGCGVTAALVSVCCVCGGIASLFSGGSASTTAKGNTAALADVAHTLKLKIVPDENKSVTVRETGKASGRTKMTMDGAAKNEDDSKTSEKVYVETVLESGTKGPKKLKRTYEKVTENKGGKEEVKSYQGKAVVFTRFGDRYQASVEGGGTVPIMDLTKLADEATEILEGRDESAMMPTKPVKVGESWTFDPKLMGPKEFVKGGQVDEAASKGAAKLVRVYTQDGKQRAQIEFNILIVIKEMRPFQLDEPLTFSAKGTLDGVIDGSSTARKTTVKIKFVMKGSMEQAGKKLMMDSDNDATIENEVSAEQ